MGSCFSFSTSAAAAAASKRPPTAKVINVDGSLMEYSRPVKVSHALGLNQPSCFLCNADSIFYGQFIHALGSDQLIEPGQLYFVLPAVKLEHRLTVVEIVELAVSASSAFAAAASTTKARSGKRSRRRRAVVEVMPIIETMDFDCYERITEFGVGNSKYGWDEKKSFANQEIEVFKAKFERY